MCDRCLQKFKSRKRLEQHEKDCKAHEAVKILTPKKGEIIKFKTIIHHYEFPLFVMLISNIYSQKLQHAHHILD